MPRIKGATVISTVKTLRKNRAAAEKLVPPRLHRYLQERLLVSEWYPEEDYRVLLGALAEIVAPMVEGNVWEFIGQQGASLDLSGVYSALIRKGDPWGTLHHADKIWSIYRDSGRLEVERIAAGEARMQLYDYPLAEPQICATMTGYFRGLLDLCGAEDIRVALVACPPPEKGPAVWSVRFNEGGHL